MMTSAIELPARPPAPAAPEPLSVLPGAPGAGELPGDVVAPGPAALEAAYPSAVAAERGASAAADAAANDDDGGTPQRAASGAFWTAPEAGSERPGPQLSAYASTTAPGGDPAADAGKTPSPATPGAGRARERERRIGAVTATSAQGPATHRRVVRREDDPRDRDREREPARDPSDNRSGYTLDDIARFAGGDAPPGPFDTRRTPWHS